MRMIVALCCLGLAPAAVASQPCPYTPPTTAESTVDPDAPPEIQSVQTDLSVLAKLRTALEDAPPDWTVADVVPEAVTVATFQADLALSPDEIERLQEQLELTVDLGITDGWIDPMLLGMGAQDLMGMLDEQLALGEQLLLGQAQDWGGIPPIMPGIKVAMALYKKWANADFDGDGVRNGRDADPFDPATSCYPPPEFW